MAEPTPIERAEALIRANPRERAAYELGRDIGFVDGYAQGWQDSPEGDPEAYDDSASKAAAYLLLAEVESGTILPRARDIAAQDPHPDAYTLAEMDALDAAARRVQAAVQALRYARKVREEASLRSFDDAEAQVQSAARELGRALGGGR